MSRRLYMVTVEYSIPVVAESETQAREWAMDHSPGDDDSPDAWAVEVADDIDIGNRLATPWVACGLTEEEMGMTCGDWADRAAAEFSDNGDEGTE